MQDGRPRRTIKARIRFDDEDYQSPSNLSAKSLPSPAPITTPTPSNSSEHISLPPKKEATITPKRVPTKLKVKLPGSKPIVTQPEKKVEPPPPPPPPPQQQPKVSPEKQKPVVEKARPPKPPPQQQPKVSPEKQKPIVEKIRPPRPRTPPIFIDVVPNTVLPFWDARTAAEMQEDDNVKELVHCQCEMPEECGLMVQCEICLTWQHGHCLEIEKPEDVMDNYICSTCSNPRLARESLRFAYDQEWLVKGKFKTLSQEQSEESKNTMMQTNKCLEEVLEIARIMQSLKIKCKILMAKDHTALKLWHRSNSEDFEDLRTHITQIGDLVDSKLISLDERVTQLESIVGVEEDDNLKKSIESLKIDLGTLKDLITQ